MKDLPTNLSNKVLLVKIYDVLCSTNIPISKKDIMLKVETVNYKKTSDYLFMLELGGLIKFKMDKVNPRKKMYEVVIWIKKY